MGRSAASRFRSCSFAFLSLFFQFAIGGAYGDQQGRSVLGTEPEKGLRFSSNSSFKVALFADLHYGEDAWTDWGPIQDVKSDRVIATVLDKETPDFVIYLGDVVTANNVPIANASLYWDQAISPTRSRGIPWASVFGNHDDAPFEWPIEWFSAPGIPWLRCPPANSSGAHRICSAIMKWVSVLIPIPISGNEDCSFRGTPRLQLMKNEIEQNQLSYSRNGPKDLWPSVSNYVLNVSSSKDPKVPVVFLYFLDSGGGSYPEVISSAQSTWFQNTSQQINPKSRVPEIIFWHIPSRAYKEVAPNFGLGKSCVGSMNREKVAAQQAEMGIMKILANRPSVKAVFVGHNHGIDWCCPYKKLWLCYARHSGYGGYGDWPRGARILEITDQPFSLKSWIRMEDGLVHSQVILSS